MLRSRRVAAALHRVGADIAQPGAQALACGGVEAVLVPIHGDAVGGCRGSSRTRWGGQRSRVRLVSGLARGEHIRDEVRCQPVGGLTAPPGIPVHVVEPHAVWDGGLDRAGDARGIGEHQNHRSESGRGDRQPHALRGPGGDQQSRGASVAGQGLPGHRTGPGECMLVDEERPDQVGVGKIRSAVPGDEIRDLHGPLCAPGRGSARRHPYRPTRRSCGPAGRAEATLPPTVESVHTFQEATKASAAGRMRSRPGRESTCAPDGPPRRGRRRTRRQCRSP